MIDRDYRGEVKVLLYNLSNEDYYGRAGDRVAQMILECNVEDPVIETVEDLEKTDCGEARFGNTSRVSLEEKKSWLDQVWKVEAGPGLEKGENRVSICCGKAVKIPAKS